MVVTLLGGGLEDSLFLEALRLGHYAVSMFDLGFRGL